MLELGAPVQSVRLVKIVVFLTSDRQIENEGNMKLWNVKYNQDNFGYGDTISTMPRYPQPTGPCIESSLSLCIAFTVTTSSTMASLQLLKQALHGVG